MRSRWAVPVVALALAFGLTACGTRSAPSAQLTPIPATPASPTTSASPAAVPSADPLADIDRQLATVDGAATQSQTDLAAGDAAASTNDDGQ